MKESKKQNKEFLKMCFFRNKGIIDKIVDFSIDSGKIDPFKIVMLKEIFLLAEYNDELVKKVGKSAKYNITYMEDEDSGEKVFDMVESFKDVRGRNLYKKYFTKTFDLAWLSEFEVLLKDSLEEKVKQYDRENSINVVLENFLNTILDKIPTVEEMDKLNTGLPSMINKIKEVTNTK